MNKLQQAYIDLGLQPGASLDQVAERWRIIARMWHPDRAATEQERTIAEAELKKVNGARDLLQRHHQDGLHRLVGCECSSDPAVDPRGATYENTSAPPPPPRASNAANGAKAKTGATNGTTQQQGNARTATARRKRPQQSAPPVVASVITAAMVLLGMSIVKMNSGGVRIDHRSDSFDGSNYAPQQTWRSPQQQQYPSGLSQSTIASLRPSPTRALDTTTTATTTAPEEKPDEQAAKERPKEKPKAPELPANTSLIEFVSGDGRLVSLQDGTTWELWPQEPADSFFHWERGERITVKGKSTSPSWLVNQSRGNQGVKVTRVE